MTNMLQPKRARARWLETAPDYILDCFDNGGATADRYTVFIWLNDGPLMYLGLSAEPTAPQGFSQWGDLSPAEFTDYRKRNGRQRVRWLDIPANVRRHARDRVESD